MRPESTSRISSRAAGRSLRLRWQAGLHGPSIGPGFSFRIAIFGKHSRNSLRLMGADVWEERMAGWIWILLIVLLLLVLFGGFGYSRR